MAMQRVLARLLFKTRGPECPYPLMMGGGSKGAKKGGIQQKSGFGHPRGTVGCGAARGERGEGGGGRGVATALGPRVASRAVTARVILESSAGQISGQFTNPKYMGRTPVPRLRGELWFFGGNGWVQYSRKNVILEKLRKTQKNIEKQLD